jgi:hypothetical protein
MYIVQAIVNPFKKSEKIQYSLKIRYIFILFQIVALQFCKLNILFEISNKKLDLKRFLVVPASPARNWDIYWIPRNFWYYRPACETVGSSLDLAQYLFFFSFLVANATLFIFIS